MNYVIHVGVFVHNSGMVFALHTHRYRNMLELPI
jgi:hypothetical protein